jgi:hypothetical protein
MAARSVCRRCVAVVAAASIAGCVVLPTHVYVPDAAGGAPVYERCSLTPDLPAGVRLERSGLHAIVSVAHTQGVNQVQVQFDVPEGLTLVLREHAIVVDARDGGAPRRATIAHINPVAPARYPETPVFQKLVLPVDTPLRGGRIEAGNLSSDRHYWIAAPVEGDLDGDIWISLPEFSVDGTPARFPEIKFTRRFTIGRGLFNC